MAALYLIKWKPQAMFQTGHDWRIDTFFQKVPKVLNQMSFHILHEAIILLWYGACLSKCLKNTKFHSNGRIFDQHFLKVPQFYKTKGLIGARHVSKFVSLKQTQGVSPELSRIITAFKWYFNCPSESYCVLSTPAHILSIRSWTPITKTSLFIIFLIWLMLEKQV